MRTELLLLAQYDGRAFLPLDVVCRDFFSELSLERLIRKVGAGDINLVVIRIDPSSQKSARVVHTNDLAAYLDRVATEAGTKKTEWMASIQRAHRRPDALLGTLPVGHDAAVDVAALPRTPARRGIVAVYFLFDGDECVYVGKSLNIHWRIATHNQSGAKTFDSYSWIECAETVLSDLEEYYILRLRPKYNIVFNGELVQ